VNVIETCEEQTQKLLDCFEQGSSARKAIMEMIQRGELREWGADNVK
jgi:hypothetical protein